MSMLVPNRFLFDFEFPLSYCAAIPKIDGDVSKWTAQERLPSFAGLDRAKDFADVWCCWHESGIAIAARVHGKHALPRCNPKSFWTGDNLRLCVDTRDARTSRRATRFCRQLYFLPTGGGRKRTDPVAGANEFKRARETAPPFDESRLRVASRVSRTGYTIEAFVPAECLNGYDPGEHARLGLYYMLEDGELGQQYLTIGDDLYWYIDPSTWATAVLER